MYKYIPLSEDNLEPIKPNTPKGNRYGSSSGDVNVHGTISFVQPMLMPF
jgi:hypothetical protein